MSKKKNQFEKIVKPYRIIKMNVVNLDRNKSKFVANHFIVVCAKRVATRWWISKDRDDQNLYSG